MILFLKYHIDLRRFLSDIGFFKRCNSYNIHEINKYQVLHQTNQVNKFIISALILLSAPLPTRLYLLLDGAHGTKSL